jgi:hypothetical protein
VISALRQKVSIDPAPGNGQSAGSRSVITGGTPAFMGISYPQATQAGSCLICVAQIAFFVGSTVQGVSDAKNGAWTQIDALQTSGNCDTRVFAVPNALSLSAGDYGNATAAGSFTTLVDSSKSWTTNQWAGYIVQDLLGNTRTISSNTSNTLTTSSGTIITTGGYYVIGDMVTVQMSGPDDYNAVTVAEISGVNATIAGHHALTATVGAGTNNVSPGNTASLAAGNYGVWGFSFNDTAASATIAPAVGTGQSDGGAYWVWDIGQPNARMQFKNTTLGSPGTISSLFSANGTDEYLTFMIALADSSAAPKYMMMRGVG